MLNVDFIDNLGRTPITFAINKNNIEIVQFLIAKGANLNQANGIGQSPLTEAVYKVNLVIVKLLVENYSPMYVNYNQIKSVPFMN